MNAIYYFNNEFHLTPLPSIITHNLSKEQQSGWLPYHTTSPGRFDEKAA
jgi:hypothetical protein